MSELHSEMMGFEATCNYPRLEPELCWRSQKLNETSDAELASMALDRAETLCGIDGQEAVDDPELNHMRFVNELRRRLYARATGERTCPRHGPSA